MAVSVLSSPEHLRIVLILEILVKNRMHFVTHLAQLRDPSELRTEELRVIFTATKRFAIEEVHVVVVAGYVPLWSVSDLAEHTAMITVKDEHLRLGLYSVSTVSAHSLASMNFTTLSRLRSRL